MEVPRKSVFKLGCGPGGNLLVLNEAQPVRLLGCDISASMIDLTRANTAGTRIENAKLDGPDLPFGDREFEIGFTATVLQHNVDNAAVSLMNEMR